MNALERIHNSLPQSPEARRRREALIRSLGGAGLIITAALVGPNMIDSFNGPEYSSEKTTVVTESGDGMQSIAEHVEGIESVDWRDVADHIAADPANTDVLSDGLQSGDVIEIPVSVEP